MLRILWISGVVGLAVFWLGSLMYLLGWKADMFNIIAIPLLVGMGQDDALHVYRKVHRSNYCTGFHIAK